MWQQNKYLTVLFLTRGCLKKKKKKKEKGEPGSQNKTHTMTSLNSVVLGYKVLPKVLCRTVGGVQMELETHGANKKVENRQGRPKDKAVELTPPNGALLGFEIPGCKIAGARTYGVLPTLDALIKLCEGCRDSETPLSNNLCYEMLDAGRASDRARLYVDIDLAVEEVQPAGALERLHWKRLNRAVREFQSLVAKYFGVRLLSDRDLFITSACTQAKTSFHVVAHHTFDRRNREAWRRELVRLRKGAHDLAGIDFSPYGYTNNVRAPFQQKYGKDNALAPFTRAHVGNPSTSVRDFLITGFAHGESALQFRAAALPLKVQRTERFRQQQRPHPYRRAPATASAPRTASESSDDQALTARTKQLLAEKIDPQHGTARLDHWEGDRAERCQYLVVDGGRKCPWQELHGAQTTTNNLLVKIKGDWLYYYCYGCQKEKRLGRVEEEVAFPFVGVGVGVGGQGAHA
jgi:hypothetical protein